MAKIPEVPIGVWKELYAAAGRFYKPKPWDYFDDDSLVGVQDPATGQTGYGCVLGALGEVLALCLYRGAEGLDFHRKAQKGRINAKNNDFLLIQNCLMMEFTDRNYLEKEDLAVVKELGLVFRGAQTWPVSRSYIPGHIPWPLTEVEARFLTMALDCVCDATSKTISGQLNLNSQPGKCLVYFPKPGTGHGQPIETRWESFPVYSPQPQTPYTLDMLKINKIISANFPDNGPWEADLFNSDIVIGDTDRPYIPKMMMVIHQDSGFIFHTSLIISGVSENQELGNTIIDAILKNSFTTTKIYLKDEKIIAALAPLGKALGIVFEHKKRLQSIINARKSLAAMTKGRGLMR